MTNKKWIQRIKIKKGSLRRQLGIKESKDINVNLLKAIEKTPIGNFISYKINGKYPGKVTKLLKRRAVLALNFRR